MSFKFSMMESFYSRHQHRYVPSKYVENMEVDDWQEFIFLLTELSRQPAQRKDKEPLISPAFYDNVLLRLNQNVSGWSFLALDFDHSATINETEQFLISQPFNYILYTTASHTSGNHRFRAFVPFDRVVDPDEMASVWDGAYRFFSNKTDPQCKDKSRGYYIPAKFNGDSYFNSVSGRDAMVVDMLKNQSQDFKLVKITQKSRPNHIPHQTAATAVDIKIYCNLIKEKWIEEYLKLPRGQGKHYKLTYKIIMRIAGQAKANGVEITADELAALMEQIAGMKPEKQWIGRDWVREAQNALDYINGFKTERELGKAG